VDQATDFKFEVIVADDCSTDGTREIVQSFTEKYPAIVRSIYQEKNTGGTKNLIDVYAATRGQYVAHMDGDDFMLPEKLKTQAKELDRNPDCTICFHEVKRYDQHSKRYLKIKPKKIPYKSNLKYLLMNPSYFTHSSKMFRAESHNGIDLVMDEMLDFFFHVHHALTGKILYLNSILGVHRVYMGLSVDKNIINNPVYQNPNPKMPKLSIDAIEYARRSGVEDEFIEKSKAKLYFGFSYSYLMARNFPKFQFYIKESRKAARLHNIQYFFGLFSRIPIFLFILVRLRYGLLVKLFHYSTSARLYLLNLFGS
jgi:glycosyltransferase involved in cell wall biosynthesis